MKTITLAEYLMGRDVAYPSDYTEQIAQNAQRTVEVINQFLTETGFDGHINSGWRPPAINQATVGAAQHSKHMLALACDLLDPNGTIDHYCLENSDVLARIGLWLEDPRSTPGWCHLQIVPPASGNRIFLP